MQCSPDRHRNTKLSTTPQPLPSILGARNRRLFLTPSIRARPWNPSHHVGRRVSTHPLFSSLPPSPPPCIRRIHLRTTKLIAVRESLHPEFTRRTFNITTRIRNHITLFYTPLRGVFFFIFFIFSSFGKNNVISALEMYIVYFFFDWMCNSVDIILLYSKFLRDLLSSYFKFFISQPTVFISCLKCTAGYAA